MSKEIYLAGGCFWGTEQYLSNINGVIKTDVGYANGTSSNPTYQQVCSGKTGHAETVRIVYDSKKVSLPFILDLYYEVINPISINQQGGDVGSQYRTGVYYTNEQDKDVILQSIAVLQKKYDEPIAIEVKPLENYYLAEDYHQKYLDKNPTGHCHIAKQDIENVKKAIDPSTQS